MIYLDNSATTQIRKEVFEAMQPYLSSVWGNPSSLHKQGRLAKQAIDEARIQVAQLLNCQPEEIYFTPCGTHSNNTAILGRARFAEANDQGKHLITTVIEHPSVIGPAKYLESQGWRVTYLPVDGEGFISMPDLERAITKETSIISVMWANNEIGTLEPIAEIAELSASSNIYFHTDAVQVPGKLPIDLSTTGINTLSISGHKFNAPKGIGALFVRSATNLMPIAFGGGQEKGLFSGTESLANIAGLGMAAELCRKELSENTNQLRLMQHVLSKEILSVPGIKITGPQDPEKRLPGHLSVAVAGADGEALVLKSDLKSICISSGSACHSGVIEPSSVLKAINLSRHEALGSARITAGKFNTLEECQQAGKALAAIFKTLLAAQMI